MTLKRPAEAEWRAISSTPFDRDLELAIINYDGTHALAFPCRRILGGWINAGTKERIERAAHALARMGAKALVAPSLFLRWVSFQRGEFCLFFGKQSKYRSAFHLVCLLHHEPKRLRDKAHLKFVASQPCLVCGRQPCDPHHLRFAQPRAIGLKVSDEFTVPLCWGHHRQLHQAGNEEAWWENLRINAPEIAKGLWGQTHPMSPAKPVVHDSDERANN